MSATFKPGDIVMVIKDYLHSHPRSGAIGEVTAVCPCLCAYIGTEGYTVDFGNGRERCFPVRFLRKLDPPADTVETERAVTA